MAAVFPEGQARRRHASRSAKLMDDSQLLDVQTFLINHAADSPQPETCGK